MLTDIYCVYLTRRLEDWIATFLRKNPTAIPPGMLVQMFGRSSPSPHPVFARLGGDKWLQKQIVAAMASPRGLAEHLRGSQSGSKKRQSVEEAVKVLAEGRKRPSVKQEERLVTQCRQCSGREPEKKLFRCSGCQYTYYWYAIQFCLRWSWAANVPTHFSSKECQKANWPLHKYVLHQ